MVIDKEKLMKQMIFLDTDIHRLNARVNTFLEGKKLIDFKDLSRIRRGEERFILKVIYEEDENNEMVD